MVDGWYECGETEGDGRNPALHYRQWTSRCRCYWHTPTTATWQAPTTWETRTNRAFQGSRGFCPILSALKVNLLIYRTSSVKTRYW